ncbi:MAG: hypothetical protein PF636_12385 [Actinomycetota bacterium]|nr:hypothetical protein [Actinomycetota bacterium]
MLPGGAGAGYAPAVRLPVGGADTGIGGIGGAMLGSGTPVLGAEGAVGTGALGTGVLTGSDAGAGAAGSSGTS